MSTSPRLTYLATAPDSILAESWAELLRQEGIQVMVRQDQPAVYLGVGSFPSRLFVLEDRLEEARRLLDELTGSPPEADEEA